MNPTPPPAPARQLQMDGLRAIAVIFVLLHHFGGPFLNHLNFGTFGVRFFFVVSGFLITRILFKARNQFENGRTNWRSELANFQMRRLIRTLPAYYLSLLVAAVLNIPPVRESLAWTLTFLTNFYTASLGYFPVTISHFWTLAVQEQFYFFWPFVIFFLPKSRLKYTFALLIVVSLVFRYWCIATDASYLVRWFNLLGNLDSFSTGGILAYASITNPGLIVKKKTRLWSGALALLSLLIALRLRLLPLVHPLSIWIELFESASMGWVIACSVSGFRGWVGSLLAWRPLTYLGQISYGIYVYHILISILLIPVFLRFGYGGQDSIALRFFVQCLVSIAVAGLSWHYFEQPMLKVRDQMARRFSSKPAAGQTCTSLLRR